MESAASNSIVGIWRNSLKHFLFFYEAKRGSFWKFFPKLFVFFILINLACYWWAMFTAFPELTRGWLGWHYFKVQFPVGFLGALFDSLSFFVTIFMVRRALKSISSFKYVAHLSVDLVIAVLATFWVVFVFSFSGWLINRIEKAPVELSARNERYQGMVVAAVKEPTKNFRNIYFGLIMGVSAMIPTCTHVGMSLHALFLWYRRRQQRPTGLEGLT